MNIYYLGPETYSELAAKKYKQKQKMQLVPLTNIDAVVDAASRDGIGIIPYRYSKELIHENLELMRARNLREISAVRIEVKFAIGKYPQSTNYSKIYSHFIALKRCDAYLQQYYPNSKYIFVEKTSDGIRKIKEIKEGLAVGRKDILLKHGLQIVGENIGHEEGNETFTDFRVVKHHTNWPYGM